MDIMSSVSETALITLKARVFESEKKNPIIKDTIGKKCLEKIQALLPADTQQRILARKLPVAASVYLAFRARKYDRYASAFLKENPDGMVVSLGCGFDTRYWRVSETPWNYVEVDLPEVIAAKKEILGDILTYRTIGCSVLAEQWIEDIQSIQQQDILFLAEGLFMYLPKPEVIGIFKKLTESFSNAYIVFETAHERLTRGLGKWIAKTKMKRSLGTDAGASYQFGIRKSSEIESYGDGIKVLETWSYFEEKDIEPKILRLFRKFGVAQWSVKARLGE